MQPFTFYTERRWTNSKGKREAILAMIRCTGGGIGAEITKAKSVGLLQYSTERPGPPHSRRRARERGWRDISGSIMALRRTRSPGLCQIHDKLGGLHIGTAHTYVFHTSREGRQWV